MAINTLHLVGLLSILFTLLKWKEMNSIINFNKILYIYVFLLLLTLYLVFISVVNNFSIDYSIWPLFLIFDVIPFSIALYVYAFSKDKFIDLKYTLVNAGLIQVVLVFLSFIFPSVQDFFVRMLINYGYSESILDLIDHRYYGLASNLTFSTPIALSFLGIVALYIGIRDKKRIYYLYSLLLLISGMINARVSIIVYAVGLVVYIVYNFKNIGIIKLGLFLVLLIPVYSIIINIIDIYSPSTSLWVNQGFNEILSLFIGTSSNTYYFSYLANTEIYRLPEGIRLLFGSGTRVLSVNSTGVRSDVGYINDVWLGGFLYAITLYSIFVIIMGKTIQKSKFQTDKMIYTALLIIFLISNIKGYIFIHNNISSILIIMVLYRLILKKRYQGLAHEICRR